MAASKAKEKSFVPVSDKLSIPENLDCIIDVKLQRSSKRLHFGRCKFEPTSSRASKKPRTTLGDDGKDGPLIDEDYKNFLFALGKYSEEQSRSFEGKEDDDGDNDFDPQYKMFTYNLREDGKSFEEKQDDDVDNDLDPQYKMFLDNLRGDGNSYILEISGEGVIPVYIKYEGEDNALSNGNGINWTTLKENNKSNLTTPRGAVDRRNLAIPREEDMIFSTIPSKEDRRNSVTSRKEDWRNSVKRGDPKSLEVPHTKPKILKTIKMEKLEPANQFSNGMVEGSGLNSESYQLFLNRQKLDDIAADILAKRGKRLKAQNVGGETSLHTKKFEANSAVKLKDDAYETSADTEKLAVTNKLVMNSADVHHQWHAKRTIGKGNSQFKEKLMEILRMPYSQKEYEVLFHEFSYRKPMQRHRDLRGGIKVYDVGRLGKSYRDHYSEFVTSRSIRALVGFFIFGYSTTRHCLRLDEFFYSKSQQNFITFHNKLSCQPSISQNKRK
ncbi:uncharacterized protein LOC126710016 isoform X1 [Quercus robur]|uniref:uncharacterized protein LOC126710016 isoform X1 n=1 Tax=Quercus robur TaxID=38942 RepID=UPI0021636271|nr:uncharacterized protein LOC126710016 isoform X1 [Quercus robur]